MKLKDEDMLMAHFPKQTLHRTKLRDITRTSKHVMCFVHCVVEWW